MLTDKMRKASLDVLLSGIRDGRAVRVSAATDSMAPTIVPADELSLCPTGENDLHTGDIVIVETHGDWIAHRLLCSFSENGERRFVTRGDNAIGSDDPIPSRQIIAKVTSICRNGQSISTQRPIGRLTGDDLLLVASMPPPIGALPDPGAADINWGKLATAAASEGLAPLIYHHHGGTEAWVGLPTEFRGIIEESHHTTLARNIVFLAELDRIAGILTGHDFIVLKGAQLALEVYSSPALRPFSDIDILVRPEALNEIDRLLRSAGFARTHALPCQPTAAQESGYLNSVEFRGRDGVTVLHLHWNISNSITPKYLGAGIDMAHVWRDAVRSADRPWLTLSPEHLVVHLAEHAMRHSFDRLILIRDIAEVAFKFAGRLNWERVAEAADLFGLRLPVYHSLRYASLKTRTCIPAGALARLAPARSGIAGRIFQRMVMSGKRSPELCALVYFEQQPSFARQLRFAVRLLFPPKPVLAAAYQRNASDIGFMTYASRLLRGAAQLSGCIRHGSKETFDA